jgi:lipid A 3-O-deacylase
VQSSSKNHDAGLDAVDDWGFRVAFCALVDRGRKMKQQFSILVAAAALMGPVISSAAPPDESNSVYGQYGQWDSARQAVIGVQSPWPIHYQGDNWITFWQGELGEWWTKKDGEHYTSSTEIAVGPVGRYYLNDSRNVYAEGVANISFIAPRYWRDSEQEGTVFDFGGAMALGYKFGTALGNEISLRAEHFSNGGMKDPNPGRNFFQIRYAVAF